MPTTSGWTRREDGRRAPHVAAREQVLERSQDDERHVDQERNGDRGGRGREHGLPEAAGQGASGNAEALEHQR